MNRIDGMPGTCTETCDIAKGSEHWTRSKESVQRLAGQEMTPSNVTWVGTTKAPT